MTAMVTLSQRNVLIPFLVVLIALSWLTLWLWGQSPYARFLSHEALRLSDVRTGFGMLLLLGGWTVMLIAMMLPTSLPLVSIFYRLTRQRADRVLLVWLLLAGYLLVWTLFGLVAVLGDSMLHETVEGGAWLETHAWLIGAGIFVLAELYQFTSLKYYCLDKCQTPLSFVMTHWQGRHDRWHAFRLGVRHGFFCLGCCWSLMLVMFAVGMSNLGWMLLLGAVMAIEKNIPWGRRVSAPLGGLLLCCGLAIVLEAMLMTL